MSKNNFTPINQLLNQQPVTHSVETEPPSIKPGFIEIKQTKEYSPPKELTAYIQKRAETVDLSPDMQQAGVQATVTPSAFNYYSVILPISDDKIVSGLHAPITSSLRWLATLAIYLLHQARITLKVIHGRVVRIIKK